ASGGSISAAPFSWGARRLRCRRSDMRSAARASKLCLVHRTQYSVHSTPGNWWAGPRSARLSHLFCTAAGSLVGGGDGPVERLMIIIQPRLSVVEHAAERALFIEINQGHGLLDDFQPGAGRLDPDFQRHRIAWLDNVYPPQRRDTIA